MSQGREAGAGSATQDQFVDRVYIMFLGLELGEMILQRFVAVSEGGRNILLSDEAPGIV